ncbi:MAG: outer membrane lipoprotein carrier protein LolA [Candidatus Hydrogenedentes bacterium]|nr:outer membrane lipoprotein carrier protein LolA [Candidatus Hydrogenedentota bacterium]
MTALLCLMFAAAAQPDPDFDAFFAEFAKRRDGVQTLEAKFTQEQITPEDPKPEKKTGTITYVKPRRILFQYDDPKVTYLVDGQRVYEYNIKAEQLQILDLENDPQTEAFFLGFDDNTERLKQAYDIKQFTPDPKDCGAKGLDLAPKHFADDLAKKERKYFEEVRISLDGDRYLPCHVDINYDKETRTQISITDIKVNSATAPKDLTIEVPERTAVIENDNKLADVGPGGAKFPRPADAKPPTISTQELKTP